MSNKMIENQKNKKRIKIIPIIMGVVVLVSLLFLIASQFAAWNLTYLYQKIAWNESDKIWLVTDKRQVNNVDKIVMEIDGKKTELTDQTLIRTLSRQAVIGDGTSFCHKGRIQTVFYLYDNNEIIRTVVKYRDENYTAKIIAGTQEDLNEGRGLGYITLSSETVEQIEQLIEQHEKELLKQTVRDVDAILRVRGAGVYGEVQEVLKGTCDYEQIRLTNHTFEDHEEYIILVNQRHNTLYELPQLPEESRMQEFFVLSIDKQAEIKQLIAQQAAEKAETSQ